MDTTASLVIKIDSSGARRATDNLDKLDRSAGKSERAAHKLGKAWGTAIGLISTAAIIGATRAFIRQADAMANLNARLGLVTDSAQGLAKAQRDVFDIAQRTATDLEATADLYFKLAQGSDELRGNQERLAGVVETVSQSLVVSGADAASTAAVIRQFSQALASGSLRGDEFISVMEGAPRLARAIADGLDVPIGSLRELAAQGGLTAEKIIRALEDQGEAVDREYGKMPLTVGRAVERVENSLQRLIGKTDETTGASADLATAIDELATVLQSDSVQQGFNSLVGGLSDVIRYGAQVVNTIAGVKQAVADMFSADAQKSYMGLLAKRWALEDKKGQAWWQPGSVNHPLAFGAKDNLERQIADLDALIAKRREEMRLANAPRPLIITADSGSLPESAFRNPPKATDRTSSTATGPVGTRATAQRALNEDVENTLSLEEEWAILEAEVYGPAAIERHNKMVTAWAEQGEEIEVATSRLDEYAQLSMQLAQGIGYAFEDMFTGFMDGTRSASDAFKEFGDNIQRIAARVVSQRAVSALMGMFFGSPAAGGAEATGGLADLYSGNGFGFAKGGVPAADLSAYSGSIVNKPTYFANGGNVMGEAGPEGIFPLKRGSDGKLGVVAHSAKGGEVYLTVENNVGPATARTEEGTAPDGRRFIRLILDAVAGDISTHGSTGKAIGNRFGLQPVGRTRG